MGRRPSDFVAGTIVGSGHGAERLLERCRLPRMPAWSIAVMGHGNIRLPAGFIWLVNHALSSTIIPSACAFARQSSQPASASEDDEVVARAFGGDDQAWQVLFDRWKKPLLGFFYRSLGSMPEAEDLTLEVFIRLHRAGAGYERRASFPTFLFHIARNVLLNELRRRRRKPLHLLPPDAFDYFETTTSADIRRVSELEESFQHALVELPESERTLLLLVQQQGLEPRVVAEMLAVTENALRVQLHRARRRLKDLMSHPK